MLSDEDFRNKNRRGHGGVNKIRFWPCNICGAKLESYGAQKRHLSVYHGKSTTGYDRVLKDEIERKK